MDCGYLIEDAQAFLPAMIRLNRRLAHRTHAWDDLSVPPNQMHTLVILKHYQPLNMSQMSDYLVVQRQQMSQIVDSLVEKGLVLRRTDPENRRQVLIELSDKGVEFLDELIFSSKGIIAEFLALLNEEQRAKFLTATTMLKEVFASLEV